MTEKFFKALIEARGLSRFGFRVHHNGNDDNPAGGITQFRSGLKAWFEINGGWRKFSDVLLIGDNNDHDPITTNFKCIKQQAHNFFGFSPNHPREFASQGGRRIMILMLPWDKEPGNLETVCLEAARSFQNRISGKIDQFHADVGADRWNSTCRKNEMWLRANLAAKCERDPFVSLRNVFSQRATMELIPLIHSSFQRIEDELARFAPSVLSTASSAQH